MSNHGGVVLTMPMLVLEQGRNSCDPYVYFVLLLIKNLAALRRYFSSAEASTSSSQMDSAGSKAVGENSRARRPPAPWKSSSTRERATIPRQKSPCWTNHTECMSWFIDTSYARYQQASTSEKQEFLNRPMGLSLLRLLAEDSDPNIRSTARQRFLDEQVDGPDNWTYRWVIRTATSGTVEALGTLMKFSVLFPVSPTGTPRPLRPWKPIESSGVRVVTTSLNAFQLFIDRIARHHDPGMLKALQAGHWSDVEAQAVQCYEAILFNPLPVSSPLKVTRK